MPPFEGAPMQPVPKPKVVFPPVRATAPLLVIKPKVVPQPLLVIKLRPKASARPAAKPKAKKRPK
eukprot:6668844-Pyramimonas_sp.AAC.1